MIDVGSKITRDDGVEFVVVGVHGSAWLAQPVAFGQVERLTGRVLAERFEVAAGKPKQDPDATEAAFVHDGDTLHASSGAANAIARENARAAQLQEPGWSALAAAHQQQISDLHRVVHDEQ